MELKDLNYDRVPGEPCSSAIRSVMQGHQPLTCRGHGARDRLGTPLRTPVASAVADARLLPLAARRDTHCASQTQNPRSCGPRAPRSPIADRHTSLRSQLCRHPVREPACRVRRQCAVPLHAGPFLCRTRRPKRSGGDSLEDEGCRSCHLATATLCESPPGRVGFAMIGHLG